MRSFIKPTSVLLLTAILASMSACGGAASTADTTAADTTTAAPETEKPYLDNLPEQDFGGVDFTMLIRETRADFLVSDEEIGEVVNDAIYARNSGVGERFNVDFKYVTLPDTGADWNTAINGDVMSGTGDYDMVMPDYWWGCETHGNFLNLRDYDDIMDFDAPWWSAGWNDNAEVNGRLYQAVGSFSLDIIRNMTCIYVNSNIADTLKLPNLYDMVEDKTWTFDKLKEYSAMALADLNGDSSYSIENDQIGSYFWFQQVRGMMCNFGVKPTTLGADGKWNFDSFYTDRTATIYSELYSFLMEDPSVVWGNNSVNNSEQALSAFQADKLLFHGGYVRTADSLREMKSDFQIIPFPLYDSTQKDYVTFNFGTAYLAITKAAKDPEMSATIMEALNAESYKSVVPAYYEDALKGKYSRDNKTADMLDLIYSKISFDFTFVHTASINSLDNLMGDWILAGTSTLASQWDSRKDSMNTKLAALYEKFNAIEE